MNDNDEKMGSNANFIYGLLVIAVNAMVFTWVLFKLLAGAGIEFQPYIQHPWTFVMIAFLLELEFLLLK